MSAWLANQVIHTTTTGKTRNKTHFMDQDFVNRPTAFLEFVTDDMDVVIIRQMAITRGRYHNLVAQRSYGTPLKYARFLRVLAKRNGSWQWLADQATEIDPSLRKAGGGGKRVSAFEGNAEVASTRSKR